MKDKTGQAARAVGSDAGSPSGPSGHHSLEPLGVKVSAAGSPSAEALHEAETPETELPKRASSFNKKLGGDESAILRRGAIFGEETFLGGVQMEYSLVARTDAVVGRAGYDEVCRSLRGCAEKT